MIETYGFLAVFTVQVLAMSVFYPARFSRYVRVQANSLPADRLAQLFPGVDLKLSTERFLTRFRAVNMGIAVLGLLLLCWFISYMQSPNWDEGAVGGRVTAYCLLQYSPIILIEWFTSRFNKVHRRMLPEAKRKATLQRRGLFDIVSPLTVLLAILAYFQFVGVVFYVARHPFPGFGGVFLNIATFSLTYVLLGAVVLYLLYGKKRGPLLTHPDRMRIVSGVATYYAWILILTSILLSLQLARKLVDLETWGPFAGNVFFLIITLLNLRTMAAPRQPEANGLASNPVRS